MAPKIIIAKLLNWSPILHISEDNKFGFIDNLTNKLRVSIFSIPFGDNKLYFLSWIKPNTGDKWNFEFCKCLRFYDIVKKESQSEIDNKTEAYKIFIEDHSDEEIDHQADFLKEKTNENQDRKSSAYNKINNYAAINLVHIGFIGYLFTEILNIKNYSTFSYLFYVIIGFSFVYTLNYFLFIKLGLSVKTFVRSTFKDLKENPTAKQLATNYYTDWYASKNDAEVMVSIVCNIEEYFIRSICVTFVLWACIIVNNNWLHETVSEVFSYESENLINDKIKDYFINYLPEFQFNVYEKNYESLILSLEKSRYKVRNSSIKRLAKKHSNIKIKNSIKVKIIDNHTVLIKYKD